MGRRIGVSTNLFPQYLEKTLSTNRSKDKPDSHFLVDLDLVSLALLVAPRKQAGADGEDQDRQNHAAQAWNCKCVDIFIYVDM